MRLVIVRHGEAEGWFGGGSDAARQLTAKGRDDVEQLAVRLACADFSVQRIIASPYVRAQQTAELLAAKLGGKDLLSTAPELQPDSKPADVISLLNSVTVDTVVLASHQPLVGRLLNLLVDKEGLPVFMPACCAVVETEIIAAGCAELVSFHRPDKQ